MTEKRHPVGSLRRIVSGGRADLAKLRALNATLQQKVAAVSDRSQYAPAYTSRQVAQLRAEAHQAVAAYRERMQPEQNLAALRGQEEQWTTAMFLSRAAVVADPGLVAYQESGNTVSLLKALLASQRVTNLQLRACP